MQGKAEQRGLEQVEDHDSPHDVDEHGRNEHYIRQIKSVVDQCLKPVRPAGVGYMVETEHTSRTRDPTLGHEVDAAKETAALD